MNLRKQLIFYALLVLFIAGCSTANQQPASSALRGRVLLWHAWTNQEAIALNNVLARFQEINPDVVVKVQAFADAQSMLDQFQVASDAGLGPDLILAPSQWVRPLSDANSVSDIRAAVETTLIERYSPAAIESLRYRDGLYGLPVTLDTTVLYYDRQDVTRPPTTLEELLAAAASGHLVALGTTFADAFWGVQAFGGQLFDAEQHVILDRGGFANWLAWLKDAREAPGMVLDSNRAALFNRFMEDGITYYVGNASEYNAMVASRSALTTETEVLSAENQIGVAVLPTGPNGSAGPFLQVQAFLFSTVSSANQRTLALALAQFATNAEQQATLMREARLVPANARVRVNPRLDPAVATFVTQARNAVPLPNGPELDAVFRLGNDAYARVLEGIMDPAAAAANTTAAINEANGFTALASAQFECKGVGTLYLGVALEGAVVDGLQQIVAELRRDCPTMLVNLEFVTLDDVAQRLMAPLAANGRIDFVIAPQSWILALAPQHVLADLTPSVNVETLQRYRPIALDALRYRNALYGLPLSMELDALYFNRSLVTEPALTLDDLRSQALNGIPIWLDTTFFHAYWGITAFGGELFDSNYRVNLDQGGFAEWLTWLKATEESSGLHVTNNRAEVERKFLAGESAYLVGGPLLLAQTRAALGNELVDVTLLPSGPAGEGQPLLRTTGFLFSQRLSPPQLALAQEFTNYATNVENQATILATAGLLPSNAGVEGADDPALATFVEQTKRALIQPNVPQMITVLEIAGQAYTAVLQNDVDPAEAAASITARLNRQPEPEEDVP